MMVMTLNLSFYRTTCSAPQAKCEKHPDGALEKLAAAEDVTEIVCTNSVPVPVSHPKLTVLSVAPALAEAIRRTHDGESVSVLFET